MGPALDERRGRRAGVGGGPAYRHRLTDGKFVTGAESAHFIVGLSPSLKRDLIQGLCSRLRRNRLGRLADGSDTAFVISPGLFRECLDT